MCARLATADGQRALRDQKLKLERLFGTFAAPTLSMVHCHVQTTSVCPSVRSPAPLHYLMLSYAMWPYLNPLKDSEHILSVRSISCIAAKSVAASSKTASQHVSFVSREWALCSATCVKNQPSVRSSAVGRIHSLASVLRSFGSETAVESDELRSIEWSGASARSCRNDEVDPRQDLPRLGSCPRPLTCSIIVVLVDRKGDIRLDIGLEVSDSGAVALHTTRFEFVRLRCCCC